MFQFRAKPLHGEKSEAKGSRIEGQSGLQSKTEISKRGKEDGSLSWKSVESTERGPGQSEQQGETLS